MIRNRKIQVTVFLTRDQYQKLREISEKTGNSLGSVIREILSESPKLQN